MAFNSNADSNVETKELSRDVVELMAAIEKLPAEHRVTVQPYLDRAVQGIKRRRRILKLVQEALSQLRLDMKYLVFDLEATRRERDEYRSQIDGE